MPINKATMLKHQKQKAEARYQRRIKELCHHQPVQLYDVYQGTTIIARVPLEQCTKYTRHKLVPVSQHEQYATSA